MITVTITLMTKMTVAHLWLNGSMVELETGKDSYASNFDKELAKGGCLCSNVELKSEEHTGW